MDQSEAKKRLKEIEVERFYLPRLADLEAQLATAELRISAAVEALEESIKLQSHYAGLLNTWDGGERLIFASAVEWLKRLAALKP